MDNDDKTKIFKINDLVDLRLIGNRTYIYVDNKEFMICARLLLNIPMERKQEADEIKSIDEAAEVFKQTLWENRIVEGPLTRPSLFHNTTITPEEEFKGHCSNIQAFFENGLSTDILASNIAFPLLKKLVDLGYEPAMRVFKEEIVIRFNEGTHNSRMFLYKGGYLNYLNEVERQALSVRFFENLNEEMREREKRREKMKMKLREEIQRKGLRGMKILEESREGQKARKEQIAVLAQSYNREWLKEKFGENHKLFETLQEKIKERREIKMLRIAEEEEERQWIKAVDMKEFKRIYKYTCEECGNFSRIRRDYCRVCGAQTLRKATKDDYKKVAEQVMIKKKEDKQIRTKLKGMIDKQSRNLQALLENDAEYKKLLKRKKSAEPRLESMEVTERLADMRYLRNIERERMEQATITDITKVQEEQTKQDDDDENFPFPYIFKPPKPPDDLALAGQGKPKAPITEQVLEYEPYCKHCGAELPKGQSICHVCGKKVI